MLIKMDELGVEYRSKFTPGHRFKGGDGLYHDRQCGSFEVFDLSGDIAPALAKVREPEGIASAVGMLRAIAGRQTKRAGLEKAVYVIGVEAEPDVSKVGIAIDPITRLGNLQSAHYLKLFLHGVAFCPTRKAETLEALVLRYADQNECRLNGEWLSRKPEDTMRLVLELARDNKIPVCDGRAWFDSMVKKTKQIFMARNH